MTTYNYADNEPIANIDLCGLQKVEKRRVSEARVPSRTGARANRMLFTINQAQNQQNFVRRDAIRNTRTVREFVENAEQALRETRVEIETNLTEGQDRLRGLSRVINDMLDNNSNISIVKETRLVQGFENKFEIQYFPTDKDERANLENEQKNY